MSISLHFILQIFHLHYKPQATNTHTHTHIQINRGPRLLYTAIHTPSQIPQNGNFQLDRCEIRMYVELDSAIRIAPLHNISPSFTQSPPQSPTLPFPFVQIPPRASAPHHRNPHLDKTIARWSNFNFSSGIYRSFLVSDR